VPSEHLVARPAEHAFGGWIPAVNLEVHVEFDDGERRGGYQRFDPVGCFLECLLHPFLIFELVVQPRDRVVGDIIGFRQALNEARIVKPAAQRRDMRAVHDRTRCQHDHEKSRQDCGGEAMHSIAMRVHRNDQRQQGREREAQERRHQRRQQYQRARNHARDHEHDQQLVVPFGRSEQHRAQHGP